MNKNWKIQAEALADTGTMSWREIARKLGKSKSTVSDHLRAYYKRLNDDEMADDPFQKIIDKYAVGTLMEVYPPIDGMTRIEDIVKKYPHMKFEPIQKNVNYTNEIYLNRAVENAKTLFFNVLDDDVKKNERILFISDLHFPYHHKDVFDFLNDLKHKYSPTRIIGLGDELDYHSLSYHDSDPDLMSAGDELRAALKEIDKLKKIFPKMDLVDSNHGSMVWRKAKTHGIPRHVIKSYKDVLNTPNWNWHNDLILTLPDDQKVYVHHGKTKDGLKLSRSMGMSTVTGHYHEDFNIRYWANPLGLYFSMQCGCLIDNDSYAFAYNNVNLQKPIIGTGLIIEGKPILEAMKL